MQLCTTCQRALLPTLRLGGLSRLTIGSMGGLFPCAEGDLSRLPITKGPTLVPDATIALKHPAIRSSQKNE